MHCLSESLAIWWLSLSCGLASSRGSAAITTTAFDDQASSCAVQIAAGGQHTVILKTDGSMHIVGRNTYGELGDGTKDDRYSFMEVLADGVSAIAAGRHHTLVLKTDGSMHAVGKNTYGELGDQTNVDRNSFVQVLADEVSAIAAGVGNTVILKNDGSMHAVGKNEYGQLGDGTNVDKPFFVQVLADGASAIAAGKQHTVILRTDGSMYAAGRNRYGQLGDGTNVDRNSFVQVFAGVAGGVSTVAAGDGHTVILQSDGSVHTVGWNAYGELGDRTKVDRNSFVQVLADGVSAIAAGRHHTLVLKTDGSMHAVGFNEYGELGDGAKVNRSSFVQVLSHGVSAIAAGRQHSVILKTDGSVHTVGRNEYGQLGDGTNADKDSFVQVRAPCSIQATASCPQLYPICDLEKDCVASFCASGCHAWNEAPSPLTPPTEKYNFVDGYDGLGSDCTSNYEGFYQACVNTDSGTTDTGGDTCVWYLLNFDSCGLYDDPDFTSNEMCCACGGGNDNGGSGGGSGGQACIGSSCTTCDGGFYFDGTACQACIAKCSVCTDGTSCTTCNGGFTFIGTACQACIANCNVCTDGGTCTTCNDGFHFDGTACQAPCADNASFQDEQGYSCAYWAGYDCTSAVSEFSYTQNGEDNILLNCRSSCGVCQATYFEITSGRCSDQGGTSITTMTQCERAAEQLNFAYSEKNTYTCDAHPNVCGNRRPQGCFREQGKLEFFPDSTGECFFWGSLVTPTACICQACQQWTLLLGKYLRGYTSAGNGCYSEAAAKAFCLQTTDCTGITKQHDQCGGTQWTLRTGVEGLTAVGFDASNLESLKLERMCEAQRYWIDDGCHTVGGIRKDDIEGYFGSAMERLAAARCCHDSNSSCVTPSICPQDLTFHEAEQACFAIGRRLCNKSELLSEICCESGGMCDIHPVWTSTSEATTTTAVTTTNEAAVTSILANSLDCLGAGNSGSKWIGDMQGSVDRCMNAVYARNDCSHSFFKTSPDNCGCMHPGAEISDCVWTDSGHSIKTYTIVPQATTTTAITTTAEATTTAITTAVEATTTIASTTTIEATTSTTTEAVASTNEDASTAEATTTSYRRTTKQAATTSLTAIVTVSSTFNPVGSTVSGQISLSIGGNANSTQVESAANAALAAHFEVEGSAVEVTVFRGSRRLKVTQRLRRLSSSWLVKFYVTVPSGKHSEAKISDLVQDTNVINLMREQLVLVGVPSSVVASSVINFDASLVSWELSTLGSTSTAASLNSIIVPSTGSTTSAIAVVNAIPSEGDGKEQEDSIMMLLLVVSSVAGLLALIWTAFCCACCYSRRFRYMVGITRSSSDIAISGRHTGLGDIPRHQSGHSSMDSKHSSARTSSGTPPPPPGKKYHFFLSHKKSHSVHGNRSEAVALNLHDMLEERGWTGFFDVDKLKNITEEDLVRHVQASCAMIVVLSDETCQSRWCRMEWEVAAEQGLPATCVVDLSFFDKFDILSQVQEANPYLMTHQWMEYTDKHRKAVASELVEWLHEIMRLHGEDLLIRAPSVHTTSDRSSQKAEASSHALTSRTVVGQSSHDHQTSIFVPDLQVPVDPVVEHTNSCRSAGLFIDPQALGDVTSDVMLGKVLVDL